MSGAILILASASRARARMLAAAGVPFEIVPADVNEEAEKARLLAEGKEPSIIAGALAALKARHISVTHPGRLVLGADQVLVFEGELISKCASLAEAGSLLRRLRGRRHTLISAAALARDGAVQWQGVEQAAIQMRDFSDAVLDAHLEEGGEELLRGVGCYRLEDRGVQLMEKVEGDHFCILGLPLLGVLAALRQWGMMAS